MAGFSKKATNIWSLWTNFSKVPTKDEAFGFHFSTGANKILRVWISSHLKGQVWIKNGLSPDPQFDCSRVLDLCKNMFTLFCNLDMA